MNIWLVILTVILIIAVISLILAHILLRFTKQHIPEKQENKGENNDKN